MRYVIWIIMMTVVLTLCGCSEKEQQVKKQQMAETVNENVQGKEGWWLKRNEDHKTPEVSDKVDLSKYDVYYADPKAGKKKCMYLTFDCGYENGNTDVILDAFKKT